MRNQQVLGIGRTWAGSAERIHKDTTAREVKDSRGLSSVSEAQLRHPSWCGFPRGSAGRLLPKERQKFVSAELNNHGGCGRSGGGN